METLHSHLQNLSTSEISEVLDRGSHAHLACRRWRQLYVVPVTYIHDGDFIYCHSRLGKKIEMMRSNPHVCLQIEEIRGLFQWRSVIIWGRYEELADLEAAKGMSLLSKKVGDLEKKRGLSSVDDEISAILSNAIFYRIHIEKATGRAEGHETV